MNLNNGASDDILNNSLLSSTIKNQDVTLNRNQSSSLPKIEREKVSTPIIDIDDVYKGEEEVKDVG